MWHKGKFQYNPLLKIVRIMETFGKIVAFTIFAALTSMFQAAVFAALWAWFVVPLFEVPAIPLVYAMGICLFPALFRHGKSQKLEDINFTDLIVSATVGPLVVLVIAWIIRLFV